MYVKYRQFNTYDLYAVRKVDSLMIKSVTVPVMDGASNRWTSQGPLHGLKPIRKQL